MSLRPSIALRNYLMESGSLKHAMSNCLIKLYSGSQPATAEAAPTGTLLCTYSKSSGARTSEVRSQGTVTFTGTSGSVDTLTVNSLEVLHGAFTNTGVLADTVTAVAAQINNNPRNQLVVASASAGVLTLTAKPGLGTLPNAWAVVSTTTTMGRTDVNMGSGVLALNGMTWGDSAAGILVKNPLETWSGTAAATGTAGWFRVEAAVADALGVDSTESILRLDGSVANSGAELNMASTAIVSAAVQTLSSFTLTFPTA